MSHLRDYVEATGAARPPDAFVSEDGFSLGKWVGRRRQEREQLSPERRAELEALPNWTWNALDAQWQEGLALLRAYANRTGKARPPVDFVTAEGFRLGSWVDGQRQARRKLSADRVAELEALPGWVWSPHEAAWQDGFRHLLDYVKETGTALPRQSYVCEDGFRLGPWVAKRRSDYRRDKLARERIEALETLPGWRWATRAP